MKCDGLGATKTFTTARQSSWHRIFESSKDMRSNWIRLQDKRLKDAVLQQFEVEPMGPVCSVIVTTQGNCMDHRVPPKPIGRQMLTEKVRTGVWTRVKSCEEICLVIEEPTAMFKWWRKTLAAGEVLWEAD
ncbi:uncharacterized protein LOC142355424 [Convolutriloba macropyga]|uniref:uncharacterized protein LOC142355424 n=1 Tax=Convolutriloba macropyga TaxID=536237 RepID=UPI003F51CA99